MPTRQQRQDGLIQRIIQQRKLVADIRGKKAKKLPRPPKPVRPDAVERAYYRGLLGIVNHMNDLVSQRLGPEINKIVEEAKADLNRSDSERRDAYPEMISRIVDGIKFSFYRALSDREIERYATNAATATEEHSRREVGKSFKRVLGIDVNNLVTTPAIRNQFSSFVKENVSLIKTIPDQYFARIEQVVHRGAATGRPTKAIAADIQNVYGITKNRAKLIARDQVAKFNGTLTQVRQTDLGISKYTWSTSLDERVRGNPSGLYPKARPSHYVREGKTFSWDDPPEDGHPGEPINCRCVAIAVFD